MRRGRLRYALAALVAALVPVGAHGAHGASHLAGRPSGRIAYVGSDGNLFVVQPDGTGKIALTSDGSKDLPYAQPEWSPTGAGILALRYAQGLQAFQHMGATGLYLVSPSGGARQLVVNIPRGYAWAPDGYTVVYETGYSPDRTTLVLLDTRTNAKRTVYCTNDFTLLAVTGLGNRAIGVQQGEIAAVDLTAGSAQAVVPVQLLTHYGSKAGLWRREVVIVRSGRTAIYSVGAGMQLVSLDLRNGHSTALRLPDPLEAFAQSPDQHWLVYSTGTEATAQAKVLHSGKGAAVPLRALSTVTAQAFAPDSSSLVFTAEDAGQPYIFAASLTCLMRCTRRLSTGADAAWGSR